MKRIASTLLLMTALSAGPAFGQGCAMCWNNANAADEGGKRTMSRAVAILLVPTLGLMAGFVGLAVRYNRQRERDLDE